MDRLVHGASDVVRNVYVILLVFVLIAMVSVVIAIKSVNRTDAVLKENQQRIIDVAASNQMILRALLDCTQPDGECSKRNAAGTAEAVGGINSITMAAATCADAPEVITFIEMRDCVEQALQTKSDGKP